MATYLIYVFIFSRIFIKDIRALQLSSVPLIYPQRSDVTVDAQTNLTLGCRGAEPMRWTFQDTVNGPHFHTSQKEILNMNNENEKEYKYETILTVYNVTHVNIGFYYCHGEKVDFDTPRRSSGIYVFVHDDSHLSVVTSKENTFLSLVWLASVPCRPTSQDINITLTCNRGVGMSVNPGNYSEVHRNDVYVVQFHSYNGFIVQYLRYEPVISHCSCVFKRDSKIFTIQLSSDSKSGLYIIDGMTVIGPATVEVGETVTLQCAYLDYLYFPYDRHWPQWDIPISRNKVTENVQLIKLKYAILLINFITIKNISFEDEGSYKCTMSSRLRFYVSDSKYIFVNDKKSNHSPPQIYSPKGGEIQINSGANITLRCEGSRPVTWSEREANQVNKSFNIEHLSYLKSGLYESYLHITSVDYSDTGFYYCHENGSLLEHPYKSTRFYIFVKDEQNLHVPRDTGYGFMDPYTNVTVPCLPTSLDVNVSLSMVRRVISYSTKSWGPQQKVSPVIHAYDPQEGFAVQMFSPGYVTATCTFISESKTDTQELDYYVYDYDIPPEPFITGPPEDLVFVGQTLQLLCTMVAQHNVPVSDDALRWIFSNNFIATEVEAEIKIIRCDIGNVLISKLILNNIKYINEGRYFCQLKYNNATTGKFISVYDQFDVKPSIENLQYDYAYIGLPLVLKCTVDVDHNIPFKMSWITNVTKIKIMNTQYIANLRNTSGRSFLLTDNVTYDNEGSYSCNVYDSTNRRTYVTKYIRIKNGTKPKVVTSNLKNKEEIVVLLEKTVKLTCSVKGDPKPVITWMKDSTVVQRVDRHIGFSTDNSELTIYYVQRNDAGLYTCKAQNSFGHDSCTAYLHVQTVLIESGYIGGLISMVIMFVVVSVVLARRTYYRKKLQKELNESSFNKFISGEIQCLNPLLSISEQANLLPYDNKWEIPRNSIELGRNLGSGCFGLVVQATVSNFFYEEPEKIVAVKMLHRNCNFIELNSLIYELKIMTYLGEHVNLINLLGACTEKIAQGNLFLVIEYCEHGSLRNYLIKNRPNFVNLIDPNTRLINLPADYNESTQDAARSSSGSVTTLQLLHWALQVARGMEYLATRKVLHGDLAARNILLDKNYVVKISDFGLSKTLSASGYYKKKSQCPLPIKWMAIESIRDKTFSTQSDVWAFGVVMWELFSLARTPYTELEPDFRFYRKLESGYRLARPEYSTMEVYQVMRECWCALPQRRPTFSRLVHTLTDLFYHHNKCCFTNDEDGLGKCTSSGTHTAAASFPRLTVVPDWIELDIIPPSCSNEYI